MIAPLLSPLPDHNGAATSAAAVTLSLDILTNLCKALISVKQI